MNELKGFQKRYLRGLAHSLKPVVQVGREGLTEGVLQAIEEGLARHELIKVKFNEAREEKGGMMEAACRRTGSVLVGAIGHTAIIYRQQADADKRKIALPQRP